MNKIELYLLLYDYVEELKPEDPDKLSDIIENIMYMTQEVMYDYAKDREWEQPEPFM